HPAKKLFGSRFGPDFLLHRGAVAMRRGVMKSTNVAIGVVLLAALGAWLLLRPQGRESQVTPAAVNPVASHTERSSMLEEALASVKSEIASLRRQQDQLVRNQRATEAALSRAVPSG